MSLVNIFRSGGTSRPSRRVQPALGFTVLEARCNPVTSLVDTNADVLGAAGGEAEILTTTPDGRYAVFSSTASDVVPGQNDAPGTPDLFWIDFQTGRRLLVTTAPNDNGTGGYAYTNGNTFGRRYAGFEAFGNGRGTEGVDVGRPVISDDGQFVAFTSKINAGVLDPAFATKAQIVGSTRALDSDRGNTSYDVFQWNRKTSEIRLMSRTFPRFGASEDLSEAFGNRTPAVNPAISADGSVVAFVSKRNAADVYDFDPDVADERDNPVVDTPDSTDDLFYTDTLQIGVTANTTTVMSKSGPNPYRDELRDDFEFFWNEEYATFGFLSQYTPIADAFFQYDPFFNIFINQPQPDAYNAQVSVAVDTLGRYLSADGKTATFVSDIHALWAIDQGQRATTSVAAQKGRHRDVYLANLQNTQPGSQTIFRINTRVDDSATNLIPTAALRGGDADNSIIVRNNADATLFTFTVGSISGRLITGSGVTITASSSGDTMELYYKEHPTGDVLGNVPVLVTGQDQGNVSTAAPPQAGGGNLLLDVNDPATNQRVDPRGYQPTQDGRFVVFTDNSPFRIAGKLANQGNDANGKFDVFRRDTRPTANAAGAALFYDNGKLIRISQSINVTPQAANGESINPVITPDGRYVAYQSTAINIVQGLDRTNVSDIYVRDLQNSVNSRTKLFVAKSFLASQSSDGTSSGNRASFGPFIGSNGGITGRVLFTSTANNLITAFPVAVDTQHGYIVDLPILGGSGDSGDVNSIDVGVVGGGLDAGVAFTNFTGNGQFLFGDRFTPFPGFLGEVRVATADVNGDIVPDIIAAPGPGGGPRVVVIDGATGTVARDFFAFESSFTGGVYVSAADINNDGFGDIIVGAGEGGGARVQVYSGRDGRKYADFFAYEATFRGGVRVAAGDINPGPDPNNVFTSFPDILTGAGLGGGPRISGFDGTTIAQAFPLFAVTPSLTPGARPDAEQTAGRNLPLNTSPTRLVDFFAYEPTLRNGVNVGLGDLNLDGAMDVVVGAGPGGGPRVIAFDSPTLIANSQQATILANLFAFDATARNGVRVSVKDIDGDSQGDLVVGQGAGQQSRVRSFAVGPTVGQTPTRVDDELLFGDFASLNGAWVG